MLWLSEPVSDAGPLEVWTEEGTQMFALFPPWLIEHGQRWLQGLGGTGDIPALQEEVSVGCGMPQPRNPPWLGDGSG